MTDFNAVSTGDVLVSRTLTDLRAEEIKLGVAVLKDQNPIHFDQRLSEAENRPGLINLGPMNMAYVMQATLDVAESAENIETYSVRFQDPVFEGDTVTVYAVVEDKREEDGDQLLDLSLELEKEDGSRAIAGNATVHLPD